MLFSLLKPYLYSYITDPTLKLSRSFYCFTIFISHGVENYFLRLWSIASLMLFFFSKKIGDFLSMVLCNYQGVSIVKLCLTLGH